MEARRGQNVLVFMVGTLHWLVGYLFNPRCQSLGKWLRFAGLSPLLPFWVAHAFSLGQLVVPASGLSSLGRQDTACLQGLGLLATAAELLDARIHLRYCEAAFILLPPF